MKVLYETWVTPINASKQFQEKFDIDRMTYYAQEIATIIKYFGISPTELSFFDFGMGRGKWALMAKGFGCRSYGTDLSEEKIIQAISNGINVIAWDEIPKHSFDFINTEQVFEHISYPLDTLIYLKGAFKANGLLKISVPTANYITRRLKLMDWNVPKGRKIP